MFCNALSSSYKFYITNYFNFFLHATFQLLGFCKQVFDKIIQNCQQVNKVKLSISGRSIVRYIDWEKLFKQSIIKKIPAK